MKKTNWIFCLLIFFCCTGCGGKTPEGFPAKVHPAKVTVVKGSEKLQNVSVYFDAGTPQNW
ncbi:MAG: hypothetical protein LBQ54_14455, partial [Planctomycetaceae bacterium]|nr:hypothetical protein [Planctomycetaceae bacterium]MDR1960219.1 hypothetical protein [Planctomycetaceae bacterium]